MSGLVTIRRSSAQSRAAPAPSRGLARAICTRKQSAITPMSEMTNASIQRNPLVCSQRIRNTSSAVMKMPISSGMPKTRLSPMAVPMTSARSVAMIASSASAQRGQRHPAREGVAAGLRQILAGADRQPRAERLQDDRHDIGEQRDRKQRVAETGCRRPATSPSCRGPCSRRPRDSPAPGRSGNGARPICRPAPEWSGTRRPAAACESRAARRGAGGLWCPWSPTSSCQSLLAAEALTRHPAIANHSHFMMQIEMISQVAGLESQRAGTPRRSCAA